MDKERKTVSLISRESDNITLDFQLLKDELESRGIEVLVLAKQLRKKLSLSTLTYIGEVIKQKKAINSSGVVVLDTYCIPASMFQHNDDTTIIQMWHALSAIKQFGWQTVGKEEGTSNRVAKLMKMHNGYDKVLCASDVTSNFFCEAFRTSKDKIVKIGLPRIDYILNDNKEVANKVRDFYPLLNNKKKTILYAPTFRGGRGVDVEGLAKAIDFSKYNLIVKLHPLDKLSTKQSTINGMVIDETFNSYDLLKVADIVISDYSSFVVEASLTSKPLYLYTYDRKQYKQSTGLNVDFSDESIGKYEFDNAEDLIESWKDDYDYFALRCFREKYIDVDTNNCTKQLADYIEDSL